MATTPRTRHSPLLDDVPRASAVEHEAIEMGHLGPLPSPVPSPMASVVDADVDKYAPMDDAPLHTITELKELLRLAFPVLVTTTLAFLPGTTSTILAGQLDSPLRKEYVDAATLSNMFTNISAYCIAIGLSTALDTLCSQAHGAKRPEKIGMYFQSAILVIGLLMIPIVIANIFTGRFLIWLGQNRHVSELAEEFSRYNAIGLPFIFFYEILRKVLQAQGIMTPLVVVSLIGNLVHIVGGYILAYHTSLGFNGIAIAKAIGNIVLPLMMWGYFKFRPQHLTQWWTPWNWRAAKEHIGIFLSLGIPGMLMLAMEWWAFEILSLLAGVLPNSVVVVSAHSVQLNVSTIIYTLFLGFAIAANVRVGNHLGANRPDRAALVSQLSMKLVGSLGLFLGVVVLVGRKVIPVLFVNDDVTVADAAKVLIIWGPFEIPEAINCLLQGIFRGAGKQTIAARTNALAYYAFGIPLAYVLAFPVDWGLQGLWFGFGSGVLLSGLTLGWIYWRWDWRALANEAQTRTAA